MSIVSPKRIQFDCLRKIENLASEFNNIDILEKIYLENYKDEYIEIIDVKIEKSYLLRLKKKT